jgi:hypothetical protein
MGTIAFRASLEVTDHPRTIELADRLLPWLDELGMGGELDPTERELLATPYGQLRREQQVDACCAGEGAAVFCWAICMATLPPRCNLADHTAITQLLQVLRPEAQDLLGRSDIRSDHELERYCREVAAIRFALQEVRFDDEAIRNTLRRVLQNRMNEIGLQDCDADVAGARAIVAAMSPEERGRSAGLYFIREHAMRWLFDSRPSYFWVPEMDEDEAF